MKNFTIDYSGLLVKKAYKLSDVKDQIEAVAFDVVRFRENDKGADLWQVQSAEDGDYIVALYGDDENAKTSSDWGVVVSKIAGTLQVSYKGDPIVRLACTKLGIPREELSQVPHYLPGKLASSKKLVKSLLSELSPEAKQQVFSKYPELA